jgi:hypothetical protein
MARVLSKRVRERLATLSARVVAPDQAGSESADKKQRLRDPQSPHLLLGPTSGRWLVRGHKPHARPLLPDGYPDQETWRVNHSPLARV